MPLTLAELAGRINAELRGDGDIVVSSVATLQQAGAGQLGFLANPKYRRQLATTRASAVILAEKDARFCPVPVLVTDNPYAGYALAAALLHPRRSPKAGIHPSAAINASAQVDKSARVDAFCVIRAGARIGPRVHIGPGSVIGEKVTVGAESRLVARVTVLAHARIGERVLLHPGVVIGSDGFGMAEVDGQWRKVPQLGSVRIGDDVEIGANSTVDRGALDDTVIENGVKIDNQVQIAHNVFIGAHTAIAGCVGISGSARIGRHCTLAGGVGVVGHIEIADHVHITGMSMVTRSIHRPGSWSAGTPLMETSRWRRSAVLMKQLDKLARRVAELEKNMENK